jgi:hypothetical protein
MGGDATRRATSRERASGRTHTAAGLVPLGKSSLQGASGGGGQAGPAGDLSDGFGGLLPGLKTDTQRQLFDHTRGRARAQSATYHRHTVAGDDPAAKPAQTAVNIVQLAPECPSLPPRPANALGFRRSGPRGVGHGGAGGGGIAAAGAGAGAAVSQPPQQRQHQQRPHSSRLLPLHALTEYNK